MGLNPGTASPKQRWTRLTLFALFALCVGVYIQGLFGGFLYDDYVNLVANRGLQALDGSAFHWVVAALSSGSGPLRRPISMLSFAVDYRWFGMNAVAFKITNLLIHLFNGALIYPLSRKLIPRLLAIHAGEPTAGKRDGLAIFVTGLWLLHPLNVSGVIYVVQRMNELSTLFTLAGLLCYAEGRLRQLRGVPGSLLAFGGIASFGTLALFSKENGALIVLYALVIEALCFRFAAPDARARASIKAFFVLTVAVPAAAFAIFLAAHPEWLIGGYSGREFTLAQRVLTEPRILFYYLLWIFVPRPSWMGMYHDDIPTSIGLLHPPSTLIAILAWASLIVLAWTQRRRTPAFTFAVAWFLAGQAMESTIIPLELAFEHRNYLPMFGVFLGGVTAIYPAAARLRALKALPAVGAVAVLVLAALTATRTADWSAPLRLAFTFAKDHPNSARSLYDAGRATVFEGEAAGTVHAARIASRPYFLRAMALDKTYVFPAVGLILSYAKDKNAVPESAIADLRYRLRNTRVFYTSTFLALMNSISDGWVSLSPGEVESLVTAALDNPKTPKAARAEIFNAYGRYQFQIQHDDQTAVSLTLAAAEEDPGNPLFQLNLAKLAIALRQMDIAARHLQLAKELDRNGLYRQEINQLKEQLGQS